VTGFKDRRQSPVIPEYERAEWRIKLFERFRQRADYKNRVADLHRIHREAVHVPPKIMPSGAPYPPSWQHEDSFRNAFVGVRHGGEGQTARHIGEQYIEGVFRLVADFLHLTADGHAVLWACGMVHIDATNYVHDPVWTNANRDWWPAGKLIAALGPDDPARNDPFNPIIPWQSVRLNIEAGIGTTAASFRIDGFGELGESVSGPGDRPFDAWDELEAAGRRVVANAIGVLRSQFEVLYPDIRRPTTVANREASLDRFVRYLLDRAVPLDDAERKSLCRFAELLGVHYPAYSHRTKTIPKIS